MYGIVKRIAPAVVLISAFTASVSGQTPTENWSPTVNGVQGRLIFVEEPAVNGTRISGLDLELRNVSDVGNPIEIYYDPTRAFRCQLFDGMNRPVPQPPYVADILTPNPYWLSLPYQGSLRFRVSVHGYGIGENKGRMIQMSCGVWRVKPDDSGRYVMRATFTTAPPREPSRRAWTGDLVLPPVEVPR